MARPVRDAVSCAAERGGRCARAMWRDVRRARRCNSSQVRIRRDDTGPLLSRSHRSAARPMNNPPTLSTVIYIAAPETTREEAQRLAARAGSAEAVLLRRRGTANARVEERQRSEGTTAETERAEWLASRPVMLADFSPAEVAAAETLVRSSLALTEAVL